MLQIKREAAFPLGADQMIRELGSSVVMVEGMAQVQGMVWELWGPKKRCLRLSEKRRFHWELTRLFGELGSSVVMVEGMAQV